MNKLQIFVLVLQLFFSYVYPQINITEGLAKEINEQVYDSDHRYPNNIVQSNKRYEPIKGSIKEAVILYSDSLKIINTYNKSGNLLNTKSFKKDELRGEYFYTYKNDGKTLIKERGVFNLDYYTLDKYHSYALKSDLKDKGLIFKYLDTLFIKDTKYQYEFTKKSKLKRIPIKNYKFEYTNVGYLKSILIFENTIRVGHLINYYNKTNQLEKQEFFWHYKWFYFDTGFPSVRNHIYEFKYDNIGILASIKQKRYNPIIHKWEESITNYKSVISEHDGILSVNFHSDSGSDITIKIDSVGNWIYKSESNGDSTEITRRTLKYFQ